MGKKQEHRREQRKKERGEKRDERAEKKKDKKDARAEKKVHRKERREERHENIKEFFASVGQGFENVVDTIWQGETDSAKKERLEKEAVESKTTMRLIIALALITVAVAGTVILHRRGKI